jgi:type I restriction-modification system DNA methylase subunit
MSACSISNAVNKSEYDRREKLYLSASESYTSDELERIAELFALTFMALEENPNQDFLGHIFCELKLHNERTGQFFTPYHVAELMSKLSYGDWKSEIQKKGYISVNDCCCGAGSLLIAFANAAKEQGLNYQQDVLFAAQDIDYTAAMMCYIQLSLLGCAGYVKIGDSLTPNPSSQENIWYTPMCFSDIWQQRCQMDAIRSILKNSEEAV